MHASIQLTADTYGRWHTPRHQGMADLLDSPVSKRGFLSANGEPETESDDPSKLSDDNDLEGGDPPGIRTPNQEIKRGPRKTTKDRS